MLFTIVTVFVKGQTVVTLQLPDNCNVNGLEDVIKNNDNILKIYPNPSNGKFSLVVSSDVFIGKATIYIHSIESKIVYSEKIFCNSKKLVKQLNLSKLVHGTYILEVKSEKEVYSKKLLIKD